MEKMDGKGRRIIQKYSLRKNKKSLKRIREEGVSFKRRKMSEISSSMGCQIKIRALGKPSLKEILFCLHRYSTF